MSKHNIVHNSSANNNKTMLEFVRNRKKVEGIMNEKNLENFMKQAELENQMKLFQEFEKKQTSNHKMSALVTYKKALGNFTEIDINDFICKTEFKACEDQLSKINKVIVKQLERNESPKMEGGDEQGQKIFKQIKDIAEDKLLPKGKLFYLDFLKKYQKKEIKFGEDPEINLSDVQFLEYKRNRYKLLKSGNVRYLEYKRKRDREEVIRKQIKKMKEREEKLKQILQLQNSSATLYSNFKSSNGLRNGSQNNNETNQGGSLISFLDGINPSEDDLELSNLNSNEDEDNKNQNYDIYNTSNNNSPLLSTTQEFTILDESTRLTNGKVYNENLNKSKLKKSQSKIVNENQENKIISSDYKINEESKHDESINHLFSSNLSKQNQTEKNLKLELSTRNKSIPKIDKIVTQVIPEVEEERENNEYRKTLEFTNNEEKSNEINVTKKSKSDFSRINRENMPGMKNDCGSQILKKKQKSSPGVHSNRLMRQKIDKSNKIFKVKIYNDIDHSLNPSELSPGNLTIQDQNIKILNYEKLEEVNVKAVLSKSEDHNIKETLIIEGADSDPKLLNLNITNKIKNNSKTRLKDELNIEIQEKINDGKTIFSKNQEFDFFSLNRKATKKIELNSSNDSMLTPDSNNIKKNDYFPESSESRTHIDNHQASFSENKQPKFKLDMSFLEKEQRKRRERNTIFVRISKAPPVELDETIQRNLEINKLLQSVGLKKDENDGKIHTLLNEVTTQNSTLFDAHDKSNMIKANDYHIKRNNSNIDCEKTQDLHNNDNKSLSRTEKLNLTILPSLKSSLTPQKSFKRSADVIRDRKESLYTFDLPSVSKANSRKFSNPIIGKDIKAIKKSNTRLDTPLEDKFYLEKRKLSDLVQTCKELNQELIENKANLQIEDFKYEFKRNMIKSVHHALSELSYADPKMLQLKYLYRKDELLQQAEEKEKALIEHLEKAHAKREADKLIKKTLITNTKDFRPALKMHRSNIKEFREHYLPNRS